jgi:hypothetical protein
MTAKRIDITDRVTGKFEDGKWVIYYNRRPIGSLTFDRAVWELEEGFEFTDGRVLAAYPAERGHTYYVSDCDMGWC